MLLAALLQVTTPPVVQAERAVPVVAAPPAAVVAAPAGVRVVRPPPPPMPSRTGDRSTVGMVDPARTPSPVVPAQAGSPLRPSGKKAAGSPSARGRRAEDDLPFAGRSLDTQIAQVTAAIAANEAPLVRLLATEQRLALARSPAARTALLQATAAVRLAAPAILVRTTALRRRRTALAAARAERMVAAVLDEASSTRLTRSLARCAAWRLPPDLLAADPRLSAVLGRVERLLVVALPGAVVPAPAPARIAYAGPFRRFGQVAILDHGRGWTTLLTGLDRLAVAPRQLVAAGDPIGTVSAALPLAGLELTRHGRAVDPVALTARC